MDGGRRVIGNHKVTFKKDLVALQREVADEVQALWDF